MRKDIDIDNYLNDLGFDIIKDKDISFLAYELRKKYVNESNLKNQLKFFDKLDLNFHKVKVFKDNEEQYLDPSNININLDSIFGAKVFYYLDSLKKEPCYTNILIGNMNSYFPKIAYIHELVHTQVNEYSNLYDDYNKEFMPLFIEFLYSDSIKYNNRVYDRLYELGMAISVADNNAFTYENKVYIKSLLQALNLYRLYNMSSISIKKEILSNIKLLFNRDIYLEDLLNKYDINYDNSKVDLNTLKRHK